MISTPVTDPMGTPSGVPPPPYSLTPPTEPNTPKTTPVPRDPVEYYWHETGVYGLKVRVLLRILQFIFAVTVSGIYGIDLSHATKGNTHAHPEWIYAEVVACLSGVTCVIHCFVTVVRVGWCAWDGVLFVLWLAQTGVFGSIFYPSVRPGYEGSTQSVTRMRAAIWICLFNMLLWLVTLVLGVGWCIRTRRVARRTDGEMGKLRRILGCGNELDVERSCWSLEQGYVGADEKVLGEKDATGITDNGGSKNEHGKLVDDSDESEP